MKQRAQEVVSRNPASKTEYRFSHALIREFLYAELGTAERGRIHRLVAEGLEKIHASHLESHLSELAHHFREASCAESAQKAFDYSIRAGQAAVEVFAYEEAAAHWNAALRLAETLDLEITKRARLHHRIGSVSRAFDFNHGIEHLEAALKLYQQIDDQRGIFKLHAELGSAYAQTTPRMNIPLALNHYREAEALAEEGGDQASLGKLYRGSGMVCVETFRSDDGLIASQRAMEIFERLGDKAGWADVKPRTRADLSRFGGECGTSRTDWRSKGDSNCRATIEANSSQKLRSVRTVFNLAESFIRAESSSFRL
ncbi:MAG: hypothetical protein Q7S58_03325 [Candidatus Binatus sp.]|uniref:hypothetical protein n=1 Tax=Candidatus Binatus sp. TaxID=2811406 RepID=UPI0027210990|nr:hypothetical protein [Candidatus Binatus sp.]MDO8431421.1 hypothetical protein [Candidatus Binatus sp.]